MPIDGGTQTAGVWDQGGVLSTHQEFGGRVTIRDGAYPSSHATHVGGTIAAQGITESATGMAPGAQIASYDWSNDLAEMSFATMPPIIFPLNRPETTASTVRLLPAQTTATTTTDGKRSRTIQRPTRLENRPINWMIEAKDWCTISIFESRVPEKSYIGPTSWILKIRMARRS